MATRTDTFDLGALRLTPGEGRQLDLALLMDPFELGGHAYTVSPATPAQNAGAPANQLPARLEISRTTGSGYALRLIFDAVLTGPCMRCLEPAEARFHVDSREVSQPGEDDDELVSPYVLESILDVGAWARDALALTLPAALLHAPDCLGLCPVCGANLNTAGPDHVHEAEPDPRWAALSELTFEGQEPNPERGSESGAGSGAQADGDGQPGGEAQAGGDPGSAAA